MPFTRLEYEKKWTNNEDFPTYESDERQVREDMQYHPDAIRKFLNEGLLKELESSTGAEKIGDRQKGTVEGSLAELFRRADAADNDIKNLAGGESPEAVRAVKVTFTAEGWAEDEATGMWELRILQSRHKRLNDAFGYRLQHLVEESYRSSTWAVMCTEVGWDSETADVVLTAASPYDGAITFFGV